MEGLPEPAAWSADHRTSEPFVFRSGGLFGSGKKVPTIGAAVMHMDRHPADGIYHLQNGTLAQWLEAEGAHDLAHLAHQVMIEGYTDPRVMLETFLLGTGLVRRPRLLLQPREMRMGYILSGQSCSHELQITKGRGRGYLFGKLHRAVPWLSLDPTSFSGRSTRVNVSVDTRTLTISPAPHEAEIAIESSGSEEPVTVPVTFRVVGMPSRFNRFVLRPLANLLAAGAIGAGLGWLFARTGGDGWLSTDRLAPVLWAVAVGILWAVLGMIRGLMAPLAWPTFYTLGRWLLRTLIWAVTLGLIAVLALVLWRQLHLELGTRAPLPWAATLIAMVALAILPGIVGELWITRGARDPSSVARRMPVLKPGIILASALLICALILVGIRFASPALQKFDTETALGSAQEWTERQLTRFDSTVNHLIDEFYLRMYDRRAPAQPTPTALPQPAPTPTATPPP